MTFVSFFNGNATYSIYEYCTELVRNYFSTK